MTRCLLIVLALLVPPRPLAAEDEYVSVFDEIHATVEAHFYDPDLRGLDWESLGRTYRARAVAADSPEAFSAVVNEMLAQLETSHTRFFTSREPAYYQLLAIFRRAFDDEIRAAHPDTPDLHYDGIGIFTPGASLTEIADWVNASL